MVVTSGEPFQPTVAPDPNPLPFTVNVNAAPPAAVLVGLMLLMAGGGGGGSTVKGNAFDITPVVETVI
jgi:hypothetical protein